MNQKTIIAIIILAVFSTVSLPLFNLYFTTPAFTNYIIKHTETRLTEIAYNISSAIDLHGAIHADTLLDQSVVAKIREAQAIFTLEKIKVFSDKGKIIFSTDPADIGNQSRQDFFEDIIKGNRAYSVLDVKKQEPATGGVTGKRSIVETYVPIQDKNETIGVFEIYYDITETKNRFGKIINKINFVSLTIAFLLLAAVVSSSIYTFRSFIAQRKVEREKDELIETLTKAKNEIKALRGIIPLCSRCNKVRDDEGYWEQVDVYLHRHSESGVSHGFCPDCYEKEITKIEDFRKERGLL